MANTTIALKKSSVPSSVPTELANGEIAINYADGKLYYKNTAGYIVELKTADLGNYFGSVNANGTLVVADTTSDVFSLVTGNNINIVGDAINDTITISLKDDVTITGNFRLTGPGGDEGGEIKLANAETNSVLVGDVTVDVYRNTLRFFETGGTNRGAYINLAATSAGVGTDLLAGASATDTVARNAAGAAYDKANTANITADLAFDKANTANLLAFNSASGANAWTNTQIALVFAQANAAYDKANTEPDFVVANAAFAQANSAYDRANSIGESSNTWTNTVFGYGNTYTQTVGAASNGWTNTIFDSANAKFLANAAVGAANDYVYTGNLYITTGNISIGRSDSPNYKLDVFGTINAAAVLVNGAPITGGSADLTPANAWTNTVFGYSNSYTQTVGAAGNSWTNSVFGYANAKFLANAAVGEANNYAYTGNLYITTGNVGIGTASPSYKLEVAGSFAAQTKSFVVDHQSKSGQKLVHGSLEGPENGVYIRGQSQSEVIELPDYWAWLVDENTITVNLISIGKYQKLYVDKIENNKVYIKNADKKSKSLHYFYTINAERKDVPKLIVES